MGNCHSTQDENSLTKYIEKRMKEADMQRKSPDSAARPIPGDKRWYR